MCSADGAKSAFLFKTVKFDDVTCKEDVFIVPFDLI